MDSQRISITIDNELSSGQKLVNGSHLIDGIGVVLPQTNRMELTIQKQGPKQNKLPTFSYLTCSNSPARSSIPSLPYPPKHRTNNMWKKTPPIPKLIWDDGISLGSYYRYAAIAGYELFACVVEGVSDEAKWEYLTFLPDLPPSHDRRRSVTCVMADLVTGIEYYFAVRSVDVHERRGPCAVEYARL
ncbi:hypothetical protein ACI65C_004165 [Semiaphis heraclei]